MPHLMDRLPALGYKPLTQRKARAERALHLVKVTEPGTIALDLRGQRVRLSKRLFQAIPAAPPDEVVKLTSAYCRVAEMILRLSRVPLAPPGSAQPDEPVRVPVLDLAPETLVPEPAPDPAPTA